MAIRISDPKVQRFYNTSPYAPLAGGKMYFYQPGQTILLKSTFTTELGDIPNANPVILDANGFEPDIFGDGSYRVVLTDSDDAQIWDRNPVNFEIGGGGFIGWSSSTTYDAGGDNIVTGSDGKYYVSIQGSNLNHDPNAGASPTFWTEFDLLKQYNANETYATDDPVTYSSDLYISLTNSNTGNTPTANPTDWKKSGLGSVTVQKFTSSGTWTKPEGTRYIIVEVIGSGGGGAGCNTSTNQTGGGAGAGGYARAVIDVGAVGNQTVIIGAAGGGGSSGANDGVAGGFSSFGSLCVATGGAKGEAPGSSVAPLGGIGTTGDILAAGGAGEPDVSSSSFIGARGGSSAFGSGGNYSGGSGANGVAARNFGGGGGGGWNNAGTSNRSGGAGAAGIVIVTEYI